MSCIRGSLGVVLAICIASVFFDGCGGTQYAAGDAGKGTSPASSLAVATVVTTGFPAATVTVGAGEGAINATGSTTIPQQSGSQGIWTTPDSGIKDAFLDLLAPMEDLPVYAPSELPRGTVLSPSWWPASSPTTLPMGADSGYSNPYVTGSGPDARVLLQVGEGWVEILEGVKGDLGDLPGTDVGSVEDRPARLYHVLGGRLVQWSDEAGDWYAVFGKGVSEEAVTRIALGMKVIR